MKNIAVFFGGNSIEHDISVITGVLTVNAIDKNLSVIPVLISKDGSFYTGQPLLDLDNYKNLDYKKLIPVTFIPSSNKVYQIKRGKLKPMCHISVAINCTHGERGEDGSISALMKLCGIALASPDTLSSAVCMDKSFTKLILKSLSIPCLPCLTVTNPISAVQAEKFNYPLIIKPNTGGSSIGITVAKDRTELELGVINALKYSDKAIIEGCLNEFIEINCACFSDGDGRIIVSECERPVGKSAVLSFSDKYEGGKREFPADIDKDIAQRIKKTTSRIYKELGFKGVVRIDYFVVEDKIFVNEINTVPGSLAYYLFCKTTKDFTLMLNEMIRQAELTFNRNQNLVKIYNSGVLTQLKSKGSKKIN